MQSCSLLAFVEVHLRYSLIFHIHLIFQNVIQTHVLRRSLREIQSLSKIILSLIRREHDLTEWIFTIIENENIGY